MSELTERERDVLRMILIKSIHDQERRIRDAKGKPGEAGHDNFVNSLRGKIGDRRSIMRKLGLL